MKKLINIAVLTLVIAGSVLTSCKNEVDDFFDKSAAERLSESLQNYSDILVAQGGKWQLEYFTTSDEPGYVYLMTFNKDGSVKISGDNVYISKLTNIDASKPSFGSETTLWDVIGDDGPVLSLSSYNKYFHLFADPEDIPGTEADEKGYGHKGDYEFDLMAYRGDTLFLQGKKHSVNMIMTRVAESIDDEPYLTNVVALADSFFNAKVPTVYMTLENGSRYVITDGASLILGMYPQYGDAISMTDYFNAIITPAGLRFMSPITLDLYPVNATVPADTVARNALKTGVTTVQTFVKQADGSLLCREDGVTKISADTINKIPLDVNMAWKLNASNLGGSLADVYNGIAPSLKAYNSTTTLQFIELWGRLVEKLDENGQVVRDPITRRAITEPVYYLYFNLRRRTSVLRLNFNLKYERTGENEIAFKLDGTGDAAAELYYANVSGIKDFVDALASRTFIVSSSSLLAPLDLKFVDKADSGSYISFDWNKHT